MYVVVLTQAVTCCLGPACLGTVPVPTAWQGQRPPLRTDALMQPSRPPFGYLALRPGLSIHKRTVLFPFFPFDGAQISKYSPNPKEYTDGGTPGVGVSSGWLLCPHELHGLGAGRPLLHGHQTGTEPSVFVNVAAGPQDPGSSLPFPWALQAGMCGPRGRSLLASRGGALPVSPPWPPALRPSSASSSSPPLGSRPPDRGWGDETAVRASPEEFG